MVWAFGRLIFIAIVTLTCIFLGVFGLRSMGSQQQFASFHHPLLEEQRSWIVAQGGDTDHGRVEQTLPALKAAHELLPEIFLGLDLRLTQDGHWILYKPKNLRTLTTGSGYISHITLDDLNKIQYKGTNEKILTIEEVLAALPNARLFINILQPATPYLQHLTALFDAKDKRQRVVFISPFMDTSRQLREESPDWLTGTTTSEFSKAQFMTSLWLETLVDLPGEVFVFTKAKDRLVSEMLRRKKIVLLATDNPDFYSAMSSQFHLSGVVTKRPSQFVQIVAQP